MYKAMFVTLLIAGLLAAPPKFWSDCNKRLKAAAK